MEGNCNQENVVYPANIFSKEVKFDKGLYWFYHWSKSSDIKPFNNPLT